MDWIAEFISEQQAGFRNDRSTTIDHAFVLQSLAQKYICKKGGRCYCLYVDFSKAFDSVPHNLLQMKLTNIGLHGNVLNMFLSMYSKLKSAVVTKEGISDFLICI